MNKNHKIKTRKSRIFIFLLAFVLPICSSAVAYAVAPLSTSALNVASYSTGHIEEVSVSNNNFSSSSSSYSLSSSLTGWSGQVSNSNTTSGTISTGSTFNSYMSSTFYLSSNPGTASSDNYVLMINSATSSSSDYAQAHQGYKSSDITLDANSFYSFQVSFKSDSSYSSETAYNVPKGTITDTDSVTVSASNFTAKPFSTADETQYVATTYNSTTYYVEKTLDSSAGTISNGTFTDDYIELELFYKTENDEEYVGVVYNDGADDLYVFVSISDTEEIDDETINVKEGANYYYCKNISYNSSSSNYKVAEGTTYYTTETTYTALTASTHGSIYLSGLVDENGEDVEVQYELVASSDWTTFYFYVATGSEEQTVSLELWLGSKSTFEGGVVFFDNVHVYQYSENLFWKNYQNNFGKSYTQTYSATGMQNKTVTTEQVTFTDLREEEETIAVIDFEDAGTYSSTDKYFADNFTRTTTGGMAKIFNTSSAAYFKTSTGFDYVGSNLAAYETITEDSVTYEENKYVLALWAEDSTIKVTLNESFDVKSNEIIKITVSYKFSGLESGSAYLYVAENEDVLTTYDLSSYTVTEETANSGVSENGEDEFCNEYGTMEIFVKGSALYNSSFSLSLGLGNDSTAATGCVIFDDIKIEHGTTEEYTDSSDIVEFGTTSGTLSVSNGNFNTVTVTDDMPYSPDDWTIESDENEIVFSGVINTDENRYEEYHQLYAQCQLDSETKDTSNPYYWAKPSNPGNPNSSTNNKLSCTPNNILMLANASTTWQKVTSPTLSLSASTTYALSFTYKTSMDTTSQSFTLTAYTSDGITLFEKEGISSDGIWSTMTIYFENGTGASEVYLVIDFGTEDAPVAGFAYFDNFTLASTDVPEGAENVVDMTEFYLNLPTNTITSDVNESETSAYTYSVSTGSSSSMMGGLVSSEMFTESEDSNLNAFAIETEDGEPVTVFYMQISGQGSSTLTSNFGIDLTADTYYALSFKVRTLFGKDLDDETEYSYGLTAGLTGFDYATEIRTDDEDEEGGYVTYTMYFCPTDDVTANLYFCLICDTPETYGMVVIYDVQLVSSEDDDTIETAYGNAETAMSESGYDVNSNNVFVAYEDGTDTSDEEVETDSEEAETSEANYDWMMYLSTIVFGLAIIVAVVGYALRHVRIKKIKKKEKIDYGRQNTVDMEVIRQKARAQRDEEVAKVQENLDRFQKELDRLEAEHKENVLKLREKDNGKLSKVTDREFKEFGQRRTVITEKIEALTRQIDDMKSAEYLLSIERKVFEIEERKRKELLKVKKEIADESPAPEQDSKKTSKTADESKTSKKAKTAENAGNDAQSAKENSSTKNKTKKADKSEKTQSKKKTSSKKDSKKDE